MKQILKQFLRRDAHPLVQFVKYVIAGGIATMVDVLVFYTLSWKVIPALRPDDPVVRLLGITVTAIDELTRSNHFIINRALTFLVSNLAAYLVNIAWVFKPGRHKLWVEVTLFYIVSLVSFAAGTFVGWSIIRAFGLSTTVAYLANMIAALLINYVCRKYVVFKG